MAKRTNAKFDQSTGQTKPDEKPPLGAAAPTGAADAAPVTKPTTEPTTESAAAGAVGQTAAASAQGATSPAAVVNETSTAEAKPMTVIVIGPKAGRWRAKRFFGAEPTPINLTDLTEAELALIEGDPLLTVQVVDAPH